MPYSITCFTIILILEIAPFLFMLVGIPYKFAMVPGLYILLYILHFSESANVHIQQHIYKKYLDL